MPYHLMDIGLNTIQPLESLRGIGQELVTLIGHLTHTSNIPGRKADKVMSGNLRFICQPGPSIADGPTPTCGRSGAQTDGSANSAGQSAYD
jgi:hypothetical protein